MAEQRPEVEQLLALERETGASLIDRTGRQVTLAAAGRLLAGHGERLRSPSISIVASMLRRLEMKGTAGRQAGEPSSMSLISLRDDAECDAHAR